MAQADYPDTTNVVRLPTPAERKAREAAALGPGHIWVKVNAQAWYALVEAGRSLGPRAARGD